MSTFSGISTALSSLIAQRQALDVAGQNIANANTEGYTRQRAELQSVSTASVPSLFSTPLASGTGVSTVGVSRLGDDFLDAKLRTQTSQASAYDSLATTLQNIETIATEPSEDGLSTGLEEFWSAWEDVANSPDASSTRTALLGKATTLTEQIASTYTALEDEWSQARSEVDSVVSQVNTAAESVAELNAEIRSILVSGGNANELIDQRSELITELSSLVGATARSREDGTVDVMVSGNQLVTGDRAQSIVVTGSYVMASALQEPPSSTDAVSLSWEGNGTALSLEGGSLSGLMTAVAPTSLGGPLSEAVDKINSLATQLATSVNTLHAAGQTLADSPNDTGVDFFSLASGTPAALGLTVAITDPDQVAAASTTGGELDGSVADQISQLREATDSPDAAWRDFVVDLGVKTEAAVRRAEVSESSRASAENLQRSNASVDTDEELANMVVYQRAYEGAARVLTAIDEMLDTLINRTGVVGR